MAKPKTHFSCQTCGAQAPKWLGRCPECGGWGSLVEETEESAASQARPAWGASGGQTKPVKLKDVVSEADERRKTGIAELPCLDRSRPSAGPKKSGVRFTRPPSPGDV